MSPPPISRRGLVVGSGAALAAVALPAGIVEALAAEAPAAAHPAALPAVFDARAFCRDLIDAGHRVTIYRPVWHGSNDDDLRPYYCVWSQAGLGDAYSTVLEKWRDAIAASPDHVEQVVAYGLARVLT